MKLLKNFLILLILGIVVIPSFAQSGSIKIVNLQTEYTSTPLGIDVKAPRFSWQMTSSIPGCYQRAYEIVVTDERNKQVWDSGKVPSGISLNIKYAGVALQPRTCYHWRVVVWDQQNRQYHSDSRFETGMMKPDENLSAWNGAKWIGGGDDDLVLYADYLPVFKLSCAMQIDSASGSTHAGLVYGANDSRLMDRNKNYFNLQNSKDSSYVLVDLDISSLSSDASATVSIYRAGYKPGDQRGKPLKTFQVSKSLINNQNKYQQHYLCISSVMGATDIYIDGESPEHLVGKAGVNPIGQGGDYIAFPVLANIGFRVAEGQTAWFSDLQVRNFRSPSNRLLHEYPTPMKLTGNNGATMKLLDPSRNAMPMLRTTFSATHSAIKKARLYVTARGIYDVYLNGRRINYDYFNPGLTQYNKTQLYQTFDVTRLVLPGKNALGAILGEGWWSGGSTYMGDFWNFFGDRQSLLAQLIITYADGKEERIVSTPGTWKYFNQGPVSYGSFFQGEVYDARKEALVKNWSTALYDDSKWQKSHEVNLKRHISLDAKNLQVNMPMVDDYTKLKLIGQFGETIKKVKELTAVSVTEPRPGVFVYDLGQNMAGVPQISLKGLPPGQEIKVRYAEVKYPDLPEYRSNVGMIMLENIRAAMSQEIYTTRGGNEVISPRFTYHGFRYIEITGIDRPLPLTSVKGLVLSSVHHLTAGYQTSNPLVNKLWQNITWSTLANFMSIPTDCPQRNERLGWSGDISVFSRTATYLAKVPEFLRRHMLAMRDVQREDGRFTDVAPLGGGFGDTLWGSAGIAVAWESYQQYGDQDLLAEHYEAMKRYIEFLIKQIDTQTKVLDDKNRMRWASLGDWLSPEYDKTEKTLLWEAYFIFDLDKMSKIAGLLGKQEDAVQFANLCNERKRFFNDTYIDKTTFKTTFRGKEVDTQTSYAVPLAFDLFNDQDKEKIIKNFAATISRSNTNDEGKIMPPYALMTGFIGTSWISTALSEAGRADLAYRQLQQTNYPSWLYPVEQGATTIWERLNSYTHTDGFGGNNNMNSFNHYSFGAVGAWMQSRSLGIQRDEDSPGFKHFVLAPEPDATGEMKYARGYYDSMYGRIESSWRRNGRHVEYWFSVPANTTAILWLAGSVEAEVKIIAGYRNVINKGKERGKFVYLLQPGTFHFVVKN